VTTVLTRMVARLLLVPVLMVAAAFLVKGYVDVGDGFGAGVIAALGVLLQYLAFGRAAVERVLPVRHAPKLAIGGLLVALAVAFVPALAGRAPLEHAPAQGAEVVHLGSLELLSAVAFDVGVFALVLGMVVATIHLIASTAEERGGRP
jgi:multisubunit Na+/H+ antiporter MnhB subunit